MKILIQIYSGQFYSYPSFGTFGVNNWINPQRYFFKAKETIDWRKESRGNMQIGKYENVKMWKWDTQKLSELSEPVEGSKYIPYKSRSLSLSKGEIWNWENWKIWKCENALGPWAKSKGRRDEWRLFEGESQSGEYSHLQRLEIDHFVAAYRMHVLF